VIVITGKNDIAVHGLLLARDNCNLGDIVVVTYKNDPGIDGWQQSLRKVATGKGVVIESLNEVYSSKIDYFISLEFDQIVKPEQFSTGSVYNIHFSKLPVHKGVHTSVRPILFGDKETVVTLQH
jgi:methionyl-tRNA formyltransferase